ncbi:hypothetical protein [Bacillus sp. M6-12]|uniref:hypothetical protein n=1 Tax=Bacillus sp. M6-12 TaxID=2054166 RepID=UPI00115B0363|nr:hypothetical protein [Bacillus sp. M6-12]
MERMHLFQKPDMILYHPGRFPELNEQLIAYYMIFGANLIMVTRSFNSFLNSREYEYYAPLLKKEGIEKEKLMPIGRKLKSQSYIMFYLRFYSTYIHFDVPMVQISWGKFVKNDLMRVEGSWQNVIFNLYYGTL